MLIIEFLQYWKSVSIAVGSFHYQSVQTEAVCGFMNRTKFLPDDMEVIFLRCLSCRANTRVVEVWRYDLESLSPIKSLMPGMEMVVSQVPAVTNANRICDDCLVVQWSATMRLHVAKAALEPC